MHPAFLIHPTSPNLFRRAIIPYTRRLYLAEWANLAMRRAQISSCQFWSTLSHDEKLEVGRRIVAMGGAPVEWNAMDVVNAINMFCFQMPTWNGLPYVELNRALYGTV